MGRKRIYHTEEEKAEAKRRNRMNWYDRNRKKILKSYKIRRAHEDSLAASSSSRKMKEGMSTVALTTTEKHDTTRSSGKPSFQETSVPTKIAESAPQIILGRVHKQSRLLRDYMSSEVEPFCIRVAEEVIATAKENQINLIQTYMDRVASFIDSARPHTMTLWNEFGVDSEWREAKTVQNSMSIVIQYLDEIHHHAEVGDLADAVSLNLLSFQ